MTKIISVVTLFVSLAMCLAQESDRSSYSPPYTCTTTTTLCQPGVGAGHPVVPSSNSPARQGKRGPSGPPGPPGLKGRKGDKGDPCQCDAAFEREISQLRNEVAELRKKIENAEVTTERPMEETTSAILEGWVRAPNGYIYLFHHEDIAGGWSGAREFCQREGGDIAMVGMRNAEIGRFLVNIAKKLVSSHYWIGMTDNEEEGNWKWVDGVSVNQGYTNWHSGQPNNNRGNENCGYWHYDWNYEWGDGTCSRSFGVICERMQ